MPVYEFDCQTCGRIEITKRMADPSPKKCPTCHGALERVYNAHFHGAVDANQESMNDGYGMFYPEAGKQFLDQKTKKHRNPDSHARSRYEMIEKLKRRGYGVEKC